MFSILALAFQASQSIPSGLPSWAVGVIAVSSVVVPVLGSVGIIGARNRRTNNATAKARTQKSTANRK